MKHLLIFVCSILLFSCQKVIDINPQQGAVMVIIQGDLYTDSVAHVIVTKSTNYLSPYKPPSIATALVVLSDNHGNIDTLSWNVFKNEFQGNKLLGVVNDVYTLTVQLEGKKYSSTSLLPYLEPADSIDVIKKAKTGFQSEKYEMYLYAKVSTNKNLYFLYKGYADNLFLNGPNDIYIGDNINSTGNLDGINIGYNKYQVGEVAKLEIYSLTEAADKFYTAAKLQLRNDGGFFSTPPANVPSMFSNNAIGLFQCSDVQVLTTTVVAQ
jgi:hypothetical protein